MKKYKVLIPFCDSNNNLKLLKVGDVIERSDKDAKKLVSAKWIKAVKGPNKTNK